MRSATTGGGRQTHARGEFALGGRRPVGQIGVRWPVRDQGAEAARIGQHPAQHLGVHDRPVHVGDVLGAGFQHQADLGHPLALQALGGRPGGIDVHKADVARPA